MNKIKELKQFLRLNKCLRWYKRFLETEAFPKQLNGPLQPSFFGTQTHLENPFKLQGSGYSYKIICNLKMKWRIFKTFNMVKKGNIVLWGGRKSGKSFFPEYINRCRIEKLGMTKIPKENPKIDIKIYEDEY